MRTIEMTQEQRERGEPIGLVPAFANLDDLFEQLDAQLKLYGLEVVMLDDANSNYVWKIERRVPDAAEFTL